MNDSTIKYLIIVVAVAAGAFLAGHLTKKCPTTDPSLIGALTASVEAKQEEARKWHILADGYKALADSLSQHRIDNIHDHVPTVIPTVPAGRTDASLDSIRAILLGQ
jgi:hypothetical protein